MLLAHFNIRSLDIWHRKRIARFLPVFAAFSFGMFVLKDYKKANLGTKYKCNPFGGKLVSAKSLFD